MKKRILSVLTALCLALTLVPAAAATEGGDADTATDTGSAQEAVSAVTETEGDADNSQTADTSADYVAMVGTTGYDSLTTAIAKADAGATVTLKKSITSDSSINIQKNLTLDLGGNTITVNVPEKNSTAGVLLTSSNPGIDVTIQNGTITDNRAEAKTIWLYGAVNLTTKDLTVETTTASDNAYKYMVVVQPIDENTLPTLTLGANTNLQGKGGQTNGVVGVTVYGPYKPNGNDVPAGYVGSKLVVKDGVTINTTGPAIMGYGAEHGTTIDIQGGNITSPNLAIYHPQNGSMTISGGTITAATGVEIRSGNLTVTGGQITGTGTPIETQPNGSGSTTSGAGIAVSQHTSHLPINVEISGGTITGHTALYENYLEEGTVGDVSMSVTGGIFQTTDAGTNAVYSKDCTGFISGGTFSSEPDESYLQTGYVATDNGDDPWTVGPKQGMDAAVTAPGDGETESSATVSGSFVTSGGNGEGVTGGAGGTIQIDVTTGEGDSDIPNRNETVTSSTVTVQSESMSSVQEANAAVELVTDVATLTIDQAAWSTMADNAKDDDVQLAVSKSDDGDKLTYTLTATAGGDNVFAPSGSEQGSITVAVPYEEKTAYVYYLGNNGPELINNAGVEGGLLSWTVSHFSVYEVRTEDSVAAFTTNGATSYTDDLREALTGVAATGGTIQLYQDVTDPITLSVQYGNNVAIYGNGHSFTVKPDEGTAETEYSKSSFVVWGGSTLTLDHVTVIIDGSEVTPTEEAKRVGFDLLDTSELTLQNGADVQLQNLDSGIRVAGAETTPRTVTIDGSKLTASGIAGNFTNGVDLTVRNGSTVDISDCGSHGLSVGNLTVDNSEVTVDGAGMYGVTASGDVSLENGAAVTVTDSGSDESVSGPIRFQGTTVDIDASSALTATGNVKNDNINLGSSTTLTNNGQITGTLKLPEPEEGSFTVTVKNSYNGQTITVATVSKDNPYTLPTQPTPPSADYTFAGWYSNGVKVEGPTVTITADTTIEARWTFTPPVVPPTQDTTPGYPSYGGSSSSSGDLITADRTTGGTVQIRPGRAEAGDTVTITATPNNGYEVGEVVVTDASGKEISVRSEGSNRYTFTMPSGKVNVDVNFVRIGSQQTSSFYDVPAGSYYADAVQWAVEQGITTGTTASTFSPNTGCTRAQIVTFLWRANGSPAPRTTTNPFTDVSPSAYYYDAVLWAVEEGITSGTTATTFGPNGGCTRAQAATFLWRAEGSPVAGGSDFSDVADGAYYAGAVDWAVANGVTQGITATTFGPNSTCTRAQIVTFLYRAMA